MSIQELKSRLSIQTVLSHYNLHPNKNQMLCCPFHSDKKASMKIYLETNTAYCFAGSCKIESLDTIDFILKMEKGTKHEAIQKAKSLIGNSSTQSIKLSCGQPGSKPSIMNTPDIELLSDLFTYFQKGIKHPQSKTAKQYKASRGLNGKVPIGYNAGSFHTGKNEKVVTRCIEAGLLKPSEHGYKIWANKCIIFPLQNQGGEIVGLYGRSTYEDGHFYLQNRKGLYPGYPDPKTKGLILSESIIDASSLLQLELPLKDYAVLALYGTNGLTTEHRQAILQSIHLEEIIFGLDGDEAGRKATKDYTRQLKELYPHLKFSSLELPEGEDLNSMYVNHEGSIELFNALFSNRKEVMVQTKKELKASTPIQQAKEESSILVQNKLITTNESCYIYQATQDLVMQVLGGIRMDGLDRLKATLKLKYSQSEVERTFRDSLDLYSAMQVEKFVKRGASRLEISSKLLQERLDHLTDLLEKERLSKLESMKDKGSKRKVLLSEETRIAKAYLSAKELMKRTGEDIGRSGVIGEEYNRLVLFIIYLSRKMEKPMHALIFGKSGSGKTHLQSSVGALVPEEDKLETTTLSDNAVYYFGENEISHFLIMIEDMDGAEGVLLALRELQSKQEVRKTVTIKDENGKMKTVTLIVRGPISLSGCTTKERIYEDNANRSFLLYVDSSADQDERIMDQQRKESAGKVNKKKRKALREQFKNLQRILKPVQVVNPYAELIKIPSQVFKPRRTNAHVIQFIEAVTYYHQYQRELKVNPDTQERYIETTIEDIEWVFKLLEPVLLNKSDELSDGCRSFFERLKTHVTASKKPTFYQKEIRSSLRLNPSNVRYYLQQFTRYDLVQQVGGSRYNNGAEYEIKSLEDYDQLKEKIAASMQSILDKIKKISG